MILLVSKIALSLTEFGEWKSCFGDKQNYLVSERVVLVTNRSISEQKKCFGDQENYSFNWG